MLRPIAALGVVTLCACSDVASPVEVTLCPVTADQPGPLIPFDQQAFIAHAGGSPSGLTQLEHYTNSREAFDASYANGFRAFEFDLLTLADGEVLVAHDFDEHHYGLDGRFADMTRDQVATARWHGKYALLFAEDLVDLMVEFPDVWIILDTKGDHTAIARTLVGLAPDDSVRDRMVPHLASEAHVAELAELYPFPERLIAVYRWAGNDEAQLERMARLGIDSIMMWFDRRWSEATQAKMDAAGHRVWVHTPPEPAQLEAFRARGVGVYSDGYITCPGP